MLGEHIWKFLKFEIGFCFLLIISPEVFVGKATLITLLCCFANLQKHKHFVKLIFKGLLDLFCGLTCVALSGRGKESRTATQ